MEVEIISRECIKPSSPTPLHLKTHKLCLLDQYHRHFYLPNFLFYPSGLFGETDIEPIVRRRLQLLKQSLSETLVHFYPLAGKMTGDFSVDCNDEGVYFVEAKVKTPLNGFLKHPDYNLMYKFFPVDAKDQDRQIAGSEVVKIQVTSFSCGGLVISACFSHVFADAKSFVSFMMTWAAAARKNNNGDDDQGRPVCLSLDASSFFPKHDSFPIELTWKRQAIRFCKPGKDAVRRFVFDAGAIAELKAKAAATTSSSLQNPSRVEAVSALISKCIMDAFKAKSSSGSHQPTLLTNYVNLRRKARPPLSDHLIGNIVWHGNALCTDADENMELLGELACKYREATMKIDGDFVQSLQGGEGFRNFFKAIRDETEMYSHVKNRITVSSWTTMGIYEIDFGWGNPLWLGLGGFGGSSFEHPTSIILMNTRSGDGIEAWVLLVQEYMALLEVNKELLAFSTLDPSPLEL